MPGTVSTDPLAELRQECPLAGRRVRLAGLAFASPQSTTSVSPYLPSMMLPGFRSRCNTPRLWA